MSHNNNSNGGKGFAPKAQQPDPPAPNPTPSPSDAYLDQVLVRADSAIASLEQAQQQNAASAIERHAQSLKLRTQELTETFSILLDPDLPVALAELRATQEVSDRLGKRRYASRTALPKVRIDIPEVPDFSRFYSPVGRSDRRLGESTTGSNVESPNAASTMPCGN
jgi:hypothetical protein